MRVLRRRIRAHAEWNVRTHIPREIGPPRRSPTRSAISRDALFVNVIARIAPGDTPHSRIR